MEAQAAVERDLNAKLQELEQHNQELRSQLEAIRKELVDVEAEKAIASPMLGETVPSSIAKADAKCSTKPKKSKEAIALPSTNPVQVEPNEATADRPHCPKCGETATVQSHGIRENKDGSSSHRWRCKPCKKSWSVPIVPSAND
ncbi:hypothetical protein [Coleofasciculus sp. FACHB-SPT9]|uniref:hypothetical protein n=1 Tax=Cyanophyceae TaxID=3028117 RepID=UPI001689A052|nr:hypothetical protein [Coleofasciculus sp. FACHB-SPT9]MBD1890481.1 hypothetical protein [Coleofasciculus sp. FACHB-SPT9]